MAEQHDPFPRLAQRLVRVTLLCVMVVLAVSVADACVPAPPQPRDVTAAKLNIKLDKVEFRDAPLSDVIDYLVEKTGTNIVIDPNAFAQLHEPPRGPSGPAAEATTRAKHPADEARSEGEEVPAETVEPQAPVGPPVAPRRDLITLSLRNVPLKEVLKYVLRYNNLRYVVEDYAILIVPIDYVPPEELVIEIFRLSTSGQRALVPVGRFGPSRGDSWPYEGQRSGF